MFRFIIILVFFLLLVLKMVKQPLQESSGLVLKNIFSFFKKLSAKIDKKDLLGILIVWLHPFIRMIYQSIYNTFPIGISLVPPSTKILAMYPSSDASNPIVALSVSISASRSPSDTLSPTFFCHLLIVPVSIVGDRAGSTTLTWLGKSTRV